MTIFCTYCSAEKETTEGLLPAVRRYRSQRIEQVYSAALTFGVGCFILSGEFGLLHWREPIPYYDHLLTAAEVPAHTAKVAAQMRQHGIGQIVYYSRSVTADEQLAPYFAVLRQACAEAEVELCIVEVEFAE